MTIRMQQRRATAQEWTDANTILASGELGIETTTGKIKVGNGSSTWSQLPYNTLSEYKDSSVWAIDTSTTVVGKLYFDNDTAFFKLGDGVSTWSNLDYFKPASAILGDAGIDFDTLAEIQALLLGGTANQLFVTPDPDGTPIWSNTLNNLGFDTVSPGTSGVGVLAWNDASGTLEFGLKGGNVTLPIGQGQVLRVRNATGSTLAKGTVVYINGSNGTNFNVTKALADADLTSAQTIGVLAEELNTSSTQHGYAMTYGLISGVDLSYISGLANGDMLFLNGTTAGRLTKTKPSAPTHLVYVGYCLSANGGGSNSTIFVKVQNGYELDEIHDVKLASLANNDILTYDSTTDPTKPVWVNKNSVSVTGNIASTAGTVSASGNITSTAGNIAASAGNVTASGNITASSATAITNTSTAHALQAGPTSGKNVRLGVDATDASIQAVNNGAYSTLDINSLGGNVNIGSASATTDIIGTIANGNTIAAGTATAGTAPLKFTSGTNLTVAEAGAVEYDGTVSYLTPNTSFGRATIATPIFTSGVGTSGIAATTNYPLFPSANDTITLPVGTYKVDLSVRMLVATSTVSSAFPFNIRGAGTAVGNFSWDGTASITDAGTANEIHIASTAITTSSSLALSAASAVAGRVYLVRGSGILRITTAGTIIPSYYWAATQTSGVVTLYAENYMMVTPLSSSGTSVSTGAWA